MNFLLFTLKENAFDLVQDTLFMEKLQLSLIPLFFTTTAKGNIYGPFLLYQKALQEKALDVLYYLPVWKEQLVPSLVVCMHSKFILFFIKKMK